MGRATEYYCLSQVDCQFEVGLQRAALQSRAAASLRRRRRRFVAPGLPERAYGDDRWRQESKRHARRIQTGASARKTVRREGPTRPRGSERESVMVSLASPGGARPSRSPSSSGGGACRRDRGPRLQEQQEGRETTGTSRSRWSSSPADLAVCREQAAVALAAGVRRPVAGPPGDRQGEGLGRRPRRSPCARATPCRRARCSRRIDTPTSSPG